MSSTKTESMMWEIKSYLMRKYGCEPAEREMYALEWYIYTGRASTLFLQKLYNAKPYMIGRILHKGGSDEEIINRIKNYIKF